MSSAISWAGQYEKPGPVRERPLYDKSSNNGNTVLGNWPDSSDNQGSGGILGTDGYQPQLILDPAGSGKQVYALTTTYPGDDSAAQSDQRVDLSDWRNFQHLGSTPNWLNSPIRTGQEWYLSWETYFPSVDVVGSSSVPGGPQTLGHYSPMGGEWNWFWQLHHDDIITGGSPHYAQVNVIMGVRSDTSTGANPRFRSYFRGGNLDSATSNAALVGGGGAIARYESPSNSLVYDHWYRFVMRFFCSNNSDGFVQLWMDSVPVIDMLSPTPVSWSKTLLNSSNVPVAQSTEGTQPTNYYRITSTDKNGNTGTSGTQYPGVANYHTRYLVNESGTVNPNNIVVLFRDWKMDSTLSAVGGI